MTTMSRSAREANVWFQRMGSQPKFIGREGVPKFTQFMNRLRSIAPTHGETLRGERVKAHHGSATEQDRRIAAAWEKRARKAMRQHRNALKDGTEFRA